MNSKILKNSVRYFAAANSYSGFVSYFDKEFSSEDYTRLYIIKGGPGTGKSSFMKKMAETFENLGCDMEYIHCSSDPKSLDGIKIRKGNKRIAIIDGTSPHERDAKIPGAVDEIINLSDNWDSRFLVGQRDKIYDIAKEKSLAYKRAYFYLSCAGNIDEYIFSIYRQGFDKNEAKIKADSLFDINQGHGASKITDRLISSFGKAGYYKLPQKQDNYFIKIPLSGSHYSGALFLSLLLETNKYTSDKITCFKSPLSVGRLEGLELQNGECFVYSSDEGVMNTEEFISISKVDLDMIGRLESYKKEYEADAVRWFEIASDMHFRLEEIYSAAMDFKKNDMIFDKKLEEIKNILEISI